MYVCIRPSQARPGQARPSEANSASTNIQTEFEPRMRGTLASQCCSIVVKTLLSNIYRSLYLYIIHMCIIYICVAQFVLSFVILNFGKSLHM